MYDRDSRPFLEVFCRTCIGRIMATRRTCDNVPTTHPRYYLFQCYSFSFSFALCRGLLALLYEDAPLVATQPTAESGRDAVSIPSRVFDDRVPSSESPSPLRMPGASTPGDAPPTPSGRRKLARVSTKDIQARITTLLGKRPSEDDEDGGQSTPNKLQRHHSRTGLRPKPIQRTRVCDDY